MLFGMLLCIGVISCGNNENDTAIDCSTPSFVLKGDTTFARITITSPVGSNFTYSLNGSQFQTSPVFSSLESGTYNVTAMNENGCTASAIITVEGCLSTAVDGIDTGYHMLFIGDLNPSLTPLRDSLLVLSVAASVIIRSQQIKRVLNGIISCNTIQFDSIIFLPTDTIRIPTTTLPVSGGDIKIWNVRAGGFATITPTGLNTRINIAQGKSNLTEPIDLSNFSGKDINFRGTFNKR
jgi:hypothetical protein